MSELLGLAFLLVSRARDKGLSEEEIVFIIEQQLRHLEMMDVLKNLGEVER
jgi:hypothetical protein